MRPVVLVDGSSYLYRAYYGIKNPPENPFAAATFAVDGVIRMLGKLIREYDPISIAVVFDASGKNFRHHLFPEYKQNRPIMPEDMRSQLAKLKLKIPEVGIPMYCVEGVEADDVIGTLAKLAEKEGKRVIIATGDKDFAQLVNENISLYNPMTNTVMGTAEVIQKFGVWPEQFVDYLALMGDSVDNIQGIPGVGAKTAAKLIAEHGSVEKILIRSPTEHGIMWMNIYTYRNRLPLAMELARIRCDIELP